MVVFFKVTKDAPPIGGIRVSCTLKVCKKCIRGLLEAWRGACTDPVRSVGGAAVRGSVVVHARALSLARVRHKLPPRGCASAGYPTFPPRVNVGFTRRCGRTRGARCARWACGGAGRPSPAFARLSARREARNGLACEASPAALGETHSVEGECPRPHGGACRRSRPHRREPARAAAARRGAARAGPRLRGALVRRQLWRTVRCARAWPPDGPLVAGWHVRCGGPEVWARAARARSSSAAGGMLPRAALRGGARTRAPRARSGGEGGGTFGVCARNVARPRPSLPSAPPLRGARFGGVQGKTPNGARNQQVREKKRRVHSIAHLAGCRRPSSFCFRPDARVAGQARALATDSGPRRVSLAGRQPASIKSAARPTRANQNIW